MIRLFRTAECTRGETARRKANSSFRLLKSLNLALLGFALVGREAATYLIRQIHYSAVTDKPGFNECAFATGFDAATFTGCWPAGIGFRGHYDSRTFPGLAWSVSTYSNDYMSGTQSQDEIDSILSILSLFSEELDFNVLRNPEIRTTIQRSASRHGMAPLVAYAIRTHLPERERAWCDRVLAQSCSSYHRSLRDLEFVAATLERRGIRLLALKGPLLASRYYDPPFLRMPSGDLDFGVRECEIEVACSALKEAGYSLDSPFETARAFSHHVVMLHPARVSLELHFRLTHGPRGLPVDRFFDQAASIRLPNGTEVLTLEGAIEIVHLALHAACGRFRPFFHLYELRRICKVNRPAILREAAAIAAECHFVGAFALIDAAFHSCWGEAFLPPDVSMPRTWLDWRINAKLYRMCGRWSELDGAHTMRSRLLGRWLDLQTTDRPFHAVRQIAMLTQFAWHQLWRRGWRDVPLGSNPHASKRVS